MSAHFRGSNFLLLVLLLISQFSNAGFVPLDEIPKFHQLIVLKSEIQPAHYVILGNDDPSRNGGRWYVLNWNDGVITSPTIQPNSNFTFNGGIGFKLETGEILYIPNGNPEGYMAGGLNEVVAGGLIDPKTGREPLIKLNVDKDHVSSLGLSKMLSPYFFPKYPPKNAATKPAPFAPNEDLLLFVVPMSKLKDQDQGLAIGLRTKLQANDEHSIYSVDYAGDPSTFYVLTFESRAKEIQKLVESELGTTPTIIRRISYISPDAPSIAGVDEIHRVELVRRIQVVRAAFNSIEDSIANRSPNETDPAAVEIAFYIHSLEQVLNLFTNFTQQIKWWQGSQPAIERLEQNFIAPIISLIKHGYGILDEMQTPLARKILLFNGTERLSRMTFLERRSGYKDETYFEHWLTLLKEKIRWVDEATDEERKKMRSRNGGRLSELGFLGIDLKDYYSANQQPPYLDENYNVSPLRIFGIKDHPIYRAALTRFVVEMDKVAELHRTKFPDELDSKLVGSLPLKNVLDGLSFEVMNVSETNRIPGFSRVRYFTQVMMVVSELLNTSRFTITNGATYFAILNAGLSLQRSVMSEFGVVPNAYSSTPELNRLTEQLILLQQAIQIRMTRELFIGQEDRFENCDFMGPK